MKTSQGTVIPHPFPYQGSKRVIAHQILPYFPRDVNCLLEPFCGASAVSISVMAHGLARKVLLNDLNKPLMVLWKEILERPSELVEAYEELWNEQHPEKKEYFFKIREKFNSSHEPHHLLYLLTRIVKGAVRYNSSGEFNQSADNRRSGMRPNTMKHNILSVSHLLAEKTSLLSQDFREVVKKANKNDLVYMDPPYQGTSFTRDHRYLNGLSYEDFADALQDMNNRNISYIISYDGKTGDKEHGKKLPRDLELKHLYINAGRSTQSTLLGNSDETVESLYLSPALVARLNSEKTSQKTKQTEQIELAFA